MSDAINPQHYRNGKNVQIIEVIRYLPFSMGNAVKYVYRCERKENAAQDVEKALWYLRDFLQRPVVVPGDKNITPALLARALEGTNPWEREAALSLLRVYFDHAKATPANVVLYNAHAAEQMLLRRLGELKGKPQGDEGGEKPRS